MNLTTLETIVGPINRGQLSGGFKPSFEVALDEVPAYFSDDRKLYKPKSGGEDLSHLNPETTGRYRELAGAVWKRMKPAERKKRLEHLSEAGKIGGSATKDMRHLHGVIINRRKL